MKSRETPFILQVRAVSRFLGILLVVFFLLVSYCSVAQESSHLQKKIHLSKGTIRLDSAFKKVKAQAGVVFSFNARRLDARQKIYIKSAIKTLSDFIEVLKAETNVSVKLMENYVVIGSLAPAANSLQADEPIITVTQKKIIEREEKERVAPKKEPIALPVKDTVKIREIPDSTRAITIDSVKILADTVKAISSDSLKSNTSGFIPVDSTQVNKILVSNPPLADTTKKVEPKPKKARKKINPFLKFGLGVDDSSILGAGAQVGIPILYATFSGNTNFKASHFRYGVGTSLKLTTSLRLHVVANTGNVKREGHFVDVYGDRYPIAVESKLHRVGAGLEFRLQNKFSVQVLALYNYLANQYFIDGEESTLEQFNTKGDEIFHTIKPLYMITDTFSPTSTSNVKTWLGLQLNFFYRINFSNKGTQ